MHDHALVVVRGKISVEFVRSVRQHLTSLLEAGARYVVVNLAEATACPPKWWANWLPHVRRCMHGRADAIDRNSPVRGERVGVGGGRGPVPNLSRSSHGIPHMS
jgi:hypothetical protein